MALEEKGLKQNKEKSLAPCMAQWHVPGPLPSLFTRTREEHSLSPPLSPSEAALGFPRSLMVPAS